MTKLKGCMIVCVIVVFIGGAIFVYSGQRISINVTMASPSKGPKRDQSPSTAKDGDLTSHGEIVVPETLTLSEQRIAGSKGGQSRRQPVDLSNDGYPKVEVDSPDPSSLSGKNAVRHKDLDERQTQPPHDVVHLPTSPDTWRQLNFDPYGKDSLVMIHIQKTGGSDFIRHLITATKDGKFLCSLPDDAQTDIQNDSVGRRGILGRGIMCPRDPSKPNGEQWLVCEKNLGWVCQLHTSYSEYKACIPELNNPKVNPNSNFYYGVVLRHPVLRYLSEYLHFKRNATWAKRRVCGGREATDSEMPPCYPSFYDKKPWPDLTIDKFLSCRSNWANNRQTRMLADMEWLGCYGNKLHPPKEKDKLMLASAKENLKNFAFFGLTEYQEESRVIFEHTFSMKLKVEATQRAMSSLHSAPILQKVWNDSELYNRIADVNRLDMDLYEYALQLFSERAKVLGLTVDFDSVAKEIDSMKPEDVRKTEKKFKRFNLHDEFMNDTSKLPMVGSQS